MHESAMMSNADGLQSYIPGRLRVRLTRRRSGGGGGAGGVGGHKAPPGCKQRSPKDAKDVEDAPPPKTAQQQG